MSNVTVFNPSQVPAFARNRGELSPMAKALAGGAGGGGKRISIKGGVFRLISGGKEVASIEDRHLDVVIVNAAPKVSRVWYGKAYDGSTTVAPDCWSNDGEKPDASAENKQAATCADCPKNIAGSGQGNSRACRFQQRVAVVLANDMEGDVLQLTAPATSVFGKEDGENRPLQAYARWLAAQNVDPGEVVTRLKFDTKSESPKLFFKVMRWLTDDEYATAQKQGQTAEAKSAITMTVAKQDGVVAAPISETIGGKRPTKAAPAPAEEDDEPPAPAPKAKKKAEAEDDGGEPTVRKEEKKPSAVPAKTALADAISNWDDE